VSARRAPLFVLMFLSPVIAELLTGSSPPAEFFSPFGLIVIVCLYGSGAILARELLVRWRKGWPSLLALGAAYGVLEEGLMVKSFTNAAHPDLGILATYGRAGGVNWVWAVELTMFHAVFSIALPILIVHLIYPERSKDAWLGSRGLAFWGAVLLLVTAFGLVFLPSRPPAEPYVAELLLFVSLVALARVLPTALSAPRNTRVPRAVHFWLLGLTSTLAFFFTFWVIPLTALPAPAAIAIGLVLALAVIARWLRMSGGAALWQDSHRVGLASGALSFFILLAPIAENDRQRLDDTRGMTLVGLAMLFFLAWAALRVRRNQASAEARG
jgi:hypothetical protein